MIFVDTGYFVALIDRRDHLHSRAVAWSRHLIEPTVTTSAVLLETFNNLSDSFLRSHPHRLLDAAASATQLHVVFVDEPLWSRGLQLHRDRPDKSWSLTDCISFTAMTDRGITRALAYDHHFEQAGFEPLLRRDPMP
jgi:predicted nucleic acid-binding protein